MVLRLMHKIGWTKMKADIKTKVDINNILYRFNRGDLLSDFEIKFALDHTQKIAELTKIIPDYRLVGFDAQRIADRLCDMRDSRLIKRQY